MACCPIVPLILLSTIASVASSQTLSLSRSDFDSYPGARAVVAADFNRDGWVDLAQANAGRDTVTVLLSQGTASRAFVRQFDVPVGHGPFDVATGDFNRDNIPDVAVANADNDTISILIGDGTGQFQRSDVVAPQNPRGIAVADMNGDAKPDIVYTGFLNNRVQVLLGDGAGGFAAGAALVGVANQPQGVAAADFNHDGRVDLAVVYASSGGGLAILYGNTTGGFTAQKVAGQANLNVVAIADLNRDGWADVAAASTGYNRMAVYFGGAGGMTYQGYRETGWSPRGIATADLNQDGRPEIVTANKESNNISVFTPSSTGSYSGTQFAAGQGSRGVVLEDFDHDGLIDVGTGNQDEATVTLLWNTTALVRSGFAFRMLDGSYGFDTYYGGVTLGDFDEDGKLDRVTMSGVIWFGNGTQGPLPALGGTAIVADANRDGHQDLVSTADSSSIGLLLGDGHGHFSTGATVRGWRGSSTAVPAVQDVDRDGMVDLVVRSAEWNGTANVGYLSVMKGNGDGTFRPPTSVPFPAGYRMAAGDVDGDAKLDLLYATYDQRNELGVAYGDGTGAFPVMRSFTVQDSNGFGSIDVADLNHDGLADVVVGTFNGTEVLLGTGDGMLQLSSAFPSGPYGAGPYAVSLGDVDRDGNIDIIGNSSVDVRFGRGDGSFSDAFRFAAFGAQPMVADMNNDGLNDIVVGDGAGVMLNRRQETNTPPTVSAGDDMTVSYADTFNEDEDNEIFFAATGFDADLHDLSYEWRDGAGTLLGSGRYLRLPRFNPGTYELTVTAFDNRGASAADRMSLTITPLKELVFYAVRSSVFDGSDWASVSDAAAAAGYRMYNPDRGRAKVTAPLADPVDYFEIYFIADPTQEYKLWVRGKADGNYWGNDSAWIQFDYSLDSSGAPAYRVGTTDALPFNLEECSGCGLSGWGWEDDGWGSVNKNGVRIRFSQGGWQRLRVQRREDGLSIDQIVLSAEKYLTTRPGTAKNDTTILPEVRR